MKEQKKINRKAGCMFTGIIEEVGEIQSIKKGANSAVITIKANTVLGDLHLGDVWHLTVSVLTATSIGKNNYSVDVMHETLRRTNLGELRVEVRLFRESDGGKWTLWRTYCGRLMSMEPELFLP